MKTLSNATPLQPSLCDVEVINKTKGGQPGRVKAARSLTSGDVLITADSTSIKALLEQDTAWTTVIAGKTRI